MGQTERKLKAYIYGLKKEGSDTIFYVGRSINLKQRLYEHRRGAHGRTTEMVVIEEVPVDLAIERERFHIREQAQLNPNILNRAHVILPAARGSDASAAFDRQRLLLEIKTHARMNDISQESIAERSNLRRSNVSRILSGRYSPELDTFLKIVEAVDMRVELTTEVER